MKLWRGMKTRCYNTGRLRYNRYGGRGIIVCDEWKNNFMAFYNFCLSNGWKKGLQLDRINNDGNYEPDNCRFVSNRVNSLNKSSLRSTNTSGYTGVSRTKRGLWHSEITVKGIHKVLGNHKTKKAAVKARNTYIKENNLENDYQIQEMLP